MHPFRMLSSLLVLALSQISSCQVNASGDSQPPLLHYTLDVTPIDCGSGAAFPPLAEVPCAAK
jgi:hypothetical protein